MADSAEQAPEIFQARRLFDGHRFVDSARVAVSDGRVVAVGRDAARTPVTDLGEVTLLPGLVDCHQHLVFDGRGTLEEQVADQSDDDLVRRSRSHARRALEGGVTTLRDLGDRNFVTLGLRGDDRLPTVLCSGPPITPVGGHCWYLGGECADRVALVAAVHERIERGCDVIKIMATGGNMTPTMPPWKSQFTLDDLQLVVEIAHEAGVPVAAHCHGVAGIADSIEAGVDTIEHCTFLNEEMDPDPDPALLERLATSGVALSATFGRCPDAAPLPRHWEKMLPKMRAAWTTVHHLGGTIVVGSDAGIYLGKPHDVTPHAIHNLLEIGMTPAEALAAITSAGADALGLPTKGRLAPGADADMIAVDGDPEIDADALTRIVQVWKVGRPILA
jgi:imidazolonepropionase-like amidohydrolase